MGSVRAMNEAHRGARHCAGHREDVDRGGGTALSARNLALMTELMIIQYNDGICKS